MRPPLEGLQVLDLTRLLPGPYCTWLLRSWGARVVKIEEPGAGDYLRTAQPVWHQHLNAGAESLALDLKRPEGRELFLRLCSRADLVLEGFRPGVMDRLGLGYETLEAANPRLVLVSISGYSDQRAGHDINYQARSGLLSLTGEMPPLQLADLSGGLFAAAGALAAVIAVRQSGAGTHVQVSLLDALLGLGSVLAAEARAGAVLERGQLMLAGPLPCYNLYETQDGGRVSLGALEAKFWRAFCEAVERPEWGVRQMDPALKPEVAALFRSRPRAAWAALAQAHDMCLEPVLDMSEAVQERESLQPIRFGGEFAGAIRGPAPGRGAQTQEFLREFGLSEQEIAALAAEGVIEVTDGQ
jgi:alpha-methylacyl-CoA racemase